MTNIDDFLRLRSDAVAMFPVLAKYPEMVSPPEAGDCDFRGFNAGVLPIYNVPPGFDMIANQAVYRTAYHEPGHEFDAWLTKQDPQQKHHEEFMTFFGLAGTWSAYKQYSAGLAYPQSWYEDPGEMWADAFADAVAGDVKVILRHPALRSPDPAALRAFFLQFLPAAPQPQPAPAPAPTPAHTFRRMGDSTNPGNVPDALPITAGYVDGTYAWPPEAFERFAAQGDIVVRICIWNNRYDADVIDIEGGNCNAEQSVPWIKGKWARGETPVVYCYSDAGPQGYRISDVRAACDAEGVAHPLFWITKAGTADSFDPSGDPEIVALQYEFDGTYDVSVVSDAWPVKEAPVSNTTGGDGGSPVPVPTHSNIIRIGQSADVAVKLGEPTECQAVFEWPSGRRATVKRTVVAYATGRFVVEVFPPLNPDDPTSPDVYLTETAIFVITVL